MNVKCINIMTKRFIHFPKIHGFDRVCEDVEEQHSFDIKDDEEAAYPKITFSGSVKVHGTNGAIVTNPEGQIYCQNHNKVLEYESEDNYKFMQFVEGRRVSELFDMVKEMYFNEGGEEDIDTAYIALFGEFAGKGIQGGVGVCSLDRFFYLFAIRLVFDDSKKNAWLKLSDYKEVEMPRQRIFNAMNFPVYKATVEFSNPQSAVKTLKDLTQKVAKDCPVAKQLGGKGKGEGLVWSEENEDKNFNIVFKTKEESFLPTKKDNVSVSAPVVESVTNFVKMTVTDVRLKQGIQYIAEQGLDCELRNARTFANWIVDDIFEEEESTIKKSGLQNTNLRQKIVSAARDWFSKYCESSNKSNDDTE